MMLATIGADRCLATPGAAGATCPGCDQPVVPKCGQVNIWHWAHARGADCDPWYEPMTAWHLGWQETVPVERREVVLGSHRADIITARGQVVEIQHSHLSAQEISEREAHYGPMIWIFDARDKAIELDTGRDGERSTYRLFRWKHARRSIAECEKTVFLDLGDQLLLVGCIYPEMPIGGWGYLWSRQQVVDCLNEPAHPHPPRPPHRSRRRGGNENSMSEQAQEFRPVEAKEYHFGGFGEVPTINGQPIPWWVALDEANGIQPKVQAYPGSNLELHVLWVPIFVGAPMPTPPEGHPDDAEPLAPTVPATTAEEGDHG